LLQRYPELASDWGSFSEDKRTSGGWYISGSEIGQVGAPKSPVDFPSALEAVADYVVRELDFWVSVSGDGGCKQNGTSATFDGQLLPVTTGSYPVSPLWQSRPRRRGVPAIGNPHRQAGTKTSRCSRETNFWMQRPGRKTL
jgi:hypothetical protein